MNACTGCGAVIPETARFCPACAAPVAAAADSDDRERKLATVLFADLVGSTELAGSQDPERTRAMLERFYDAMAEEIGLAGGTVEKFAGDAVMAVFGAPAALEDHAERALHVALGMHRRLHQIFGGALSLRIGVNTGDVVVGKPREGSSFVTGDPVNVAARLEQAAQNGSVLVGERTVATTRGAFEFGEPRTVQAKGKPAGVPCRQLVRALSLMRPRGVGGLSRAFVGRADDLDLLEGVYADVSESQQPQLVTVLGDAGVGKTRLLREFWERLAGRSREPVRRTGRCLSYGQGITYWPLGEVLKEHLGILDSDPPGAVLERLGGREILGLTLGLDVAQGLHPLAARDRFQDAWVEFLEELVREGPAVVLIEDVHWADEQLLDLLERIVRKTRGPLLLVATARPELLQQHPGWGARLKGTCLELEALSPEDAVSMLDELLDGSLPPGLGEVVIERAEGNPFFVEEIVATLIDRQLLERVDGTWRLRPLPGDFAVPDTMQAVVASRVDLLDPAEKQALQAAAVIGRIFWAGPVYQLTPDAAPDLEVLEDRDFIRRRAGSSFAREREYAIKHQMTREVAYASLSSARRARSHAGFARWLERTGEGRDEYAPLLAHHYAQAVRPDAADLAWSDIRELADLRRSALAATRRAGALAIGRFEIDDGLALLHQALELTDHDPERVELWREIGHANALKFDGEAFWTAMQKALQGSDRATAADSYSQLAFYTATRAAMWKRRPDPALITGWIEQALALSEPASKARARTLIAQAISDPEQFGAAAGEAREIATALDDDELLSFAWRASSLAADALGDYQAGYAWNRRRFELLPRFTDPDHIAIIYFSSVCASITSGRIEQARLDAKALDDVSRRLTPHHRLHAVWTLIEVDVAAGSWAAVRELTTRAEAVVAANVATPCALNVWTLLACALAHTRLGDDQESARLERSAEELGMEGYGEFFDPLRLEICVARRALGEVERMLSDWRPQGFVDVDGLVAQLNALVALGRHGEIEQLAPALLMPGSYLEPFALRALGCARADHQLIGEAAQQFERMGAGARAVETRELLERGHR